MVFYLLFVVLECLETFFFHFWYHLKMIHDVKTILSLSIFFSICSSSFCQWSNPFMLCWSFKYFSFLAGKCSWSDCWSLLGGLGVANRILFYFLSSELLADNHFYLLMTASQIDYLFFLFWCLWDGFSVLFKHGVCSWEDNCINIICSSQHFVTSL